MAMKSSSGADMRFVFLILGLSLIPFVLSASELDCTNGTVIITYPSGSSVTVNGVGANGCVDTNGYFTLVQNGNQCWGSGGSACATPSGCCGCCASGLQCGGSAQYDNQYWIGCRPTGTSGGITNATCNAVSSSGGTTTAAPTTTPHSGTTTAAPVGNKKLYCPSSNDLVAAYGSPSITNRGWSITGGAAVATKASYNLIGGWVSYTANWASVPTGVNANIYSVSPNFGGASSFTNAQYCDGQAATSTKPWCVEIDWIESNGNCGGQTTLHTSNINGNGNSGATNVCGTSGCLNNYVYSGTASFPMNVSFTSAGVWNVVWNGHTIGGSSVTPAAGSGDWAALLNAYTQLGAVIYSSQWTGWVPTPGSCSSTQGNLAAATFTISNLQIYGSVVQGPTPTSC